MCSPVTETYILVPQHDCGQVIHWAMLKNALSVKTDHQDISVTIVTWSANQMSS